MTGDELPTEPDSEAVIPPDAVAPRPLGWWRFALQFVTVMLVYVAGSVPPVLILGMTSSIGLALSAVTGMGAGLIVAWLWLRSDRAVAQAWDLSPPQSWPRTIGIAVAAAIGIQLWFQIGSWLAELAGLPKMDAGMVIGTATESPLSLAVWVLAVGCFSAGFGEELMWRGFLLDRFSRLRGIRGRIWLAVLLQALVFGVPHAYEGGASAIIVVLVIGLFFGWLRLRLNGNLWALVIAHALVDSSSIIAAYVSKVYGLG